MEAFAIILALTLAGWFICTYKFTSWDFRNNLWAPAYLLIHGKSPYRISVLFDNSNAVWFPQIIGALFPLGLLSQYQASNLWLLINVFAAMCLVIFLMRQPEQKKPTFLIYGFVLLGVFLFPPSVTLFTLGQVDFLLIATILTGTYMIEKHNTFIAALCFAIALTKPQICFLVIPSTFIALILARRWKYSLEIAALIGMFMFALTIPLWVVDSNWVKDFIWNLRSNPDWLQPALLTQLVIRFAHYGFILWLLVAIFCLALSTVLWIKLVPHQAVLWSMALTTIAAPYLWSWDFTLLLPLFVYTAARLTKIYARLVLFSTWVAIFFFSIWSRQFDKGDNRLWWLPLLMLLGLALSLILEYKNAIHPTPPLIDTQNARTRRKPLELH